MGILLGMLWTLTIVIVVVIVNLFPRISIKGLLLTVGGIVGTISYIIYRF
jgi:FtsH-binding integral membrane protein